MKNQHHKYIKPPSWRQTFVLSGLVLFTWIQLFGLTQQQLSQELNKHVKSSLVKKASLGISVWDTKNGQQLYGHRETAALLPASIAKIYTSVSCLEHLGPEYRWQTTLGYRGEIVSGILKGDLIILGGGDPTWYDEFWPNGPKQLFKNWADSLSALGITKIEGNLVGNTSMYPTRSYNPYWSNEDKPYYYTPAVSSISFISNCITVMIYGGASAGKKVTFNVVDGYDYLKLSSQYKTVKAGSRVGTWAVRGANERTYILKGKVGAGVTTRERLAVREPDLFTLHELSKVLKQEGISHNGKVSIETKKPDTEEWQPLFTQISPPLSEVMVKMMKQSSSFLAESMLHTLDSSYDGALNKVMETVQTLGVSTNGLQNQDGCGLSRSARTSARQLGELLMIVQGKPWFELFLSSFPIAGQDGTLKNRFEKSPAMGSVFGKTGTLSGVCNMAGYIKTKTGELLAFAIIVNKSSSSGNAKNWQEKLCDILYLYSETE